MFQREVDTIDKQEKTIQKRIPAWKTKNIEKVCPRFQNLRTYVIWKIGTRQDQDINPLDFHDIRQSLKSSYGESFCSYCSLFSEENCFHKGNGIYDKIRSMTTSRNQ